MYVAVLPDSDIYFQTKNPNLSKFWRALQWKKLVYFMDIWSFCGNLVYFYPFWYVVLREIWQPWYVCVEIGQQKYSKVWSLQIRSDVQNFKFEICDL
jgi:hypothetical protein